MTFYTQSTTKNVSPIAFNSIWSTEPTPSAWNPHRSAEHQSTKTWSLPKVHSIPPPGLAKVQTNFSKLSVMERALEEELVLASALYRLKAAQLRHRINKINSKLGQDSPLETTSPQPESESSSATSIDELCMSFAKTGHCHYRNNSSDSVPSLETASNSSGESTVKSVILYKTEMCESFSKNGMCPYNEKCKFAHGTHELRQTPRHPKFKSTICRNFAANGTCPYGKRCCFLHEQ